MVPRVLGVVPRILGVIPRVLGADLGGYENNRAEGICPRTGGVYGQYCVFSTPNLEMQPSKCWARLLSRSWA